MGAFRTVANPESHDYAAAVPPRRHPANPAIGRVLEQLRRDRGMTQIDVVFALGGIGVETGVSTLQRWEATGSIKRSTTRTA